MTQTFYITRCLHIPKDYHMTMVGMTGCSAFDHPGEYQSIGLGLHCIEAIDLEQAKKQVLELSFDGSLDLLLPDISKKAVNAIRTLWGLPDGYHLPSGTLISTEAPKPSSIRDHNFTDLESAEEKMVRSTIEKYENISHFNVDEAKRLANMYYGGPLDPSKSIQPCMIFKHKTLDEMTLVVLSKVNASEPSQKTSGWTKLKNVFKKKDDLYVVMTISTNEKEQIRAISKQELIKHYRDMHAVWPKNFISSHLEDFCL